MNRSVFNFVVCSATIALSALAFADSGANNNAPSNANVNVSANPNENANQGQNQELGQSPNQQNQGQQNQNQNQGQSANAGNTGKMAQAGKSGSATMVSAQELNQGKPNLIGKQVIFNGKVDRVIGPGAYIMTDAKGPDNAAHRVLVLTSGQALAGQQKGQHQEAGMAAPTFKEGQKVQLQGKVEQLNVSNEVEQFSPKSHEETINETAASTPVIVAPVSSIHAQ